MDQTAAPGTTARGVRSGAPGPMLLLALAAFLLAPICLAAGLSYLPGTFRSYVMILPLPVLAAEAFLVFAVLILPAFCANSSEGGNAALSGLWKGGVAATLALLVIVIARVAGPVDDRSLPLMWLMLGATAAGVAGVSTAWGARGAALAAVLCCVPALAGYCALDVYPAVAWLGRLSPFGEIARISDGGSMSWGGYLPGLALLAVSLIGGRRSS